MFSLERQKATFANLNLRAEKHGDENIPAADLHFTVVASNDVLSEFDPELKSAFYRKPRSGEQDELDVSPGYLPKLRFPKMGGWKWEYEITGGLLTVHYGTGGRSDIALDMKKVDAFKFNPMDGGSVEISFRVRCAPDEKQVGKLSRLIKDEIEISLEPPRSDFGTDANEGMPPRRSRKLNPLPTGAKR